MHHVGKLQISSAEDRDTAPITKIQQGCSTCFHTRCFFALGLPLAAGRTIELDLIASSRDFPGTPGCLWAGNTEQQRCSLFCSSFLEPVPPPVPCGLWRGWESSKAAARKGRTLCHSARLAFQFLLLKRVPCFPSLPRTQRFPQAGGQEETAASVTAAGEGGRAGDGAARCLPSHEALLPWKASI